MEYILHYEKFADGTTKCIEDEIPFDLPEGWEWTRIFSVSFNLPYGTAKKSDSNGKVVVLRMGNLQNGEIDYTDLVYSSDDEDIEQYKLIANDLLFNRTNSAELVGKTAIYRGNIKAIYAGYLIRLRTGLNSEYLNSVMNSQYERDYCNTVKTDGVNQSNINAQKLGAFLVPVPPISEQCHIISKLNNLLSFIDTIESDKTDLKSTIQQTREKILDLAIRGKLVPQDPTDEPASVLLERIREEKENLIRQGKIKRDKKESVIYRATDGSHFEIMGSKKVNIDGEIPFNLPDGWAWCRLSNYALILNGDRGKNYPSKDKLTKNGIPFISASDINNGIVVENNMLCMTEKQYNLLSAGKLLCNDIVFCIRGSIGKCGVFHFEKGAIASSLVIVRSYLSSTSSMEYLFNYLNSPVIKSEITKYDNGSAQPNLAAKDFMKFLLPLPPLEEQKRIVDKINQLFSFLDTITDSLE